MGNVVVVVPLQTGAVSEECSRDSDGSSSRFAVSKLGGLNSSAGASSVSSHILHRTYTWY